MTSVYWWQRPGSLMASKSGSEAEPLLRRIQKLERLRLEAGAQAVKLSEPRMRKWVSLLMYYAIREKNRAIFESVYARYRGQLSALDRLFILVSRFLPRMAMVQLYRFKELLKECRIAVANHMAGTTRNARCERSDADEALSGERR